MIDWTNGKLNARSWTMKMMIDGLGNEPKQILVTNVSAAAAPGPPPPPRECKLVSTSVDHDYGGGDICEFNMSSTPSPATCAAACCAHQGCSHFVTLAPGDGYVGAGVCKSKPPCPVGGSCCYLKTNSANPMKSMYPKGDAIAGSVTPSALPSTDSAMYARAFAPTAGMHLPNLAKGKGAVLLANLNENRSLTVTFAGLKGATLWAVVHGKSGAWDVPFAKSVSMADTLEMEPLAVYLAFVVVDTPDSPLKSDDGDSDRGHWSGPELRLASTAESSFPALSLDGGDPFPPFWLNLGADPSPPNAMIVQLVRARDAGIRLVTICSPTYDSPLDGPFSSATKITMDLIQLHHPKATILVRWYINVGDAAWLMTLQNMSDATDTITGGARGSPGSLNSVISAWAVSVSKNLSAGLRNLDAAYPGKIAGVTLEGLSTGEWFLPVPPTPTGFTSDYSVPMEAAFCAAESSTGSDSDSCRLPSGAERAQATLGNALLQWNQSADPSARAFRYNRFVSHQVTQAISTLAAAVKQVSNGKLFMFGFYGYVFALSDFRLTGSAHLDLSSLLECEALDAVASPYQYLATGRHPAGRLTVHGPHDSAAVRGKLWVIEDDTRTALSELGTSGRYFTDATVTVNVLRRNLYISMLKKSAIYWLDLQSHGWFGRDDNDTMVAITDAIWNNTSHALSQWQTMLNSSSVQQHVIPSTQPEVAIFVDEISAGARPLLGLGAFETALLKHPWQDLAGIGAPVRVHLLSDLLNPNFTAKGIKMAVMLNAAMISAKLRKAIKTKL